MNLFENAIIEISGKCNAKCRWCVTGRDNRYGCQIEKTVVSFDRFRQIYQHITRLGLIGKKNDIMLYSWGEPFLNPEAMQIFDFLSAEQQMFSLSTNASVFKVAVNSSTYAGMSSVAFSMPGFSQKSYDRMHGFNFNVIQSNICRLLEDMRGHGFSGSAVIIFHVYQFNQDEIDSAKKFADSLDAEFFPYYAYFNGLSLVQKFIRGTFTEEEWKEAQDEICLHYVEKRLSDVPSDFRCRLRKILTIDEMGNLVLCCAADRQIEGYILGDIFSFDSVEAVNERLDTAMSENLSCRECHEKKVDAWLTKFEKYDYTM